MGVVKLTRDISGEAVDDNQQEDYQHRNADNPFLCGEWQPPPPFSDDFEKLFHFLFLLCWIKKRAQQNKSLRPFSLLSCPWGLLQQTKLGSCCDPIVSPIGQTHPGVGERSQDLRQPVFDFAKNQFKDTFRPHVLWRRLTIPPGVGITPKISS